MEAEKHPFKYEIHLNQNLHFGVLQGVSDVERLLGSGSAQGCLTGCNFCFILLLLVLWCFCLMVSCVCVNWFLSFFCSSAWCCIHDIWMFVLILVLCVYYSCNVRPVMFFRSLNPPQRQTPVGSERYCRWPCQIVRVPQDVENWVVGPTWNPKPGF